jgi:hypothetical protein
MTLIYQCALTTILFTAPTTATTPATAPSEEPTTRLRPALVQMALDAEVLDPREERYYPAADDDDAHELSDLLDRFDALASAPHVEECRRFPDRKLVNDYLSFNRSYRNDLLARLAVDMVHADELRTALAETEQLYLIWNTLRDAQCEYYYVTVRRQSLTQLRDLIGMRGFYAGEMPPHVPYWHFPQQR